MERHHGSFGGMEAGENVGGNVILLKAEAKCSVTLRVAFLEVA